MCHCRSSAGYSQSYFLKNPSQIRIQAKIGFNPELDTSSLTLYRVDENLGLIGDSICTLLDNGNPANGDSAAGDSIYSCIAHVQVDDPGVTRLAVRTKFGGSYVFCPSVRLGVVTPLTEQTIQDTLDAQTKVAQIWGQQVAKYGNTKKARTNTAKALKKVKGIKSVTLSKDTFVIYLQFEAGMKGSVVVYPQNFTGNAAQLTRPREIGKSERPPAIPGGTVKPTPNPAQKPPMSETLTTGTNNCRVGSCKAFIYSPFFDDFGNDDTGDMIDFILERDPTLKQKFGVTFLKSEECTVDALFGIGQGDYGTVVINSHGVVGSDNNIEIMTRDEVALEDLGDAEVLNLLDDSALIWTYTGFYTDPKKSGWFYSFKPNFISNWVPGRFKNGITLMASCYGGANGSMAMAFFGKGMLSYFGMTNWVYSDYLKNCSKVLFEDLVSQGMNTEEAYADVPDRTQDPNHSNSKAGFVMMAYPVPLIYNCAETGNGATAGIWATLNAVTHTEGNHEPKVYD